MPCATLTIRVGTSNVQPWLTDLGHNVEIEDSHIALCGAFLCLTLPFLDFLAFLGLSIFVLVLIDLLVFAW